MKRGVPAAELPTGTRHDTRKHTRHILRPTREIVTAYLADPSQYAWSKFAAAYGAILMERFATDRDRFDGLARLARHQDVYLGCSCPTKTNPDLRRCHTWLALEFMGERYPELDVRFPDSREPSEVRHGR